MASPTCDVNSPVRQGEREKKHLLDLPLELLQLIALHLDVATFFTSLLTCKRFMDAANARPTILRHLQNIPGLRLGLEHLSTLRLFQLFRKRAAEGLCGAGVLANIKSYVSTQSEWSNSQGPNRHKVSQPVFSLALPAQIAMADDLGIIRVFQLDDQRIRLASELGLPSLGPSDQCGMAVLKMAFSTSKDLAVLYKPSEPTKVSEPSPFHRRAKSVPMMIVVYHHRLSSTGEVCYSIDEHETTEVSSPPGTECVGLAIAPNGNVCVGWQSHLLHERTDFWLVVSNSKEHSGDSASNIIVLRDPVADRNPLAANQPIFHMSFIKGGRGLNFYEPGNPIHSWFTNYCDLTEPDTITWHSRRNVSSLKLDCSFEEFEIGMPFRGFHGATVARGTPFCRYSYLAIGITKTILPASAFIVQSDYAVPTPICEHSVDLDGARSRVEWKLVAFLAGWRLGASSLGTVMAISSSGNRVAAATWDRLLIWTLDADLLHQGGLQHYFPVRDFNTRKGFGRLRPTKLSTEGIGVIHSLRWASETSLFASTEHGLVQWGMGILNSGERQILSLDQQASPHEAISLDPRELK